jgi:flagellar motor switch/type III secretory pathway protein FliN
MSAGPGLERASSDVSRAEAQVHTSETEELRWRPALSLPCQLTVDLPLPRFSVSDLLQLRVGSVVPTNWRLARDVPLRVNGTLIGWSEFEVVGSRLAIRLTELA